MNKFVIAATFLIAVGNCFAADSDPKSEPVYNPKNGHYYEFVGEIELTWTEAKRRAEARTMVDKDGKPHSFNNWRPGEPNNRGNEKFMQWNHYLRPGDLMGTWNDQAVDKVGSNGYFVEYGGL